MNEQYLGHLTDLEKNIGYTFKDKNLLLEAVTHSSFANERKINKLRCNERLEFLGDAVLEIISSDYLFKRFEDLPEGKLSKMRSAIVCEPALFECSHAIKLSEFILLGKGEDNGGGREKPSVVSDAFEALIGAVYLDGGMDEAGRIIKDFILTEEQVKAADISDSKSYLQELVQKDGLQHSIEYNILSETGPEHDKKFIVSVVVDGIEKGRGEGKNKKAAEKSAAMQAIKSGM